MKNSLLAVSTDFLFFLWAALPSAAQETTSSATETTIPNIWLYAGAGLALIVILIVIFLLMRKNRSKNQKFTNPNHRRPVNTVFDGATLELNLENADASKNAAIVSAIIADGKNQLFGRKSDTNVIGLNGDSSISSIHIKISNNRGALYINDMASASGVILNGEKIQTRMPLNDGDLLKIGNQEFKASIHVV